MVLAHVVGWKVCVMHGPDDIVVATGFGDAKNEVFVFDGGRDDGFQVILHVG